MRSYYQSLWSKFKRNFVQYSFQAIKDPKWFLMFCVTRIQILRSIGILVNRRAIDQTYQKINQGNNTLFPNLDIRKICETLNEDGLFLGINLPSDILQEILVFSSSIKYYANNNPNLKFSLVDKEKSELKYQQNFAMATHVHRSILCPAIQRLEDDPTLREIAARYLDTNPILIDTRIRWTFPVNDPLNESVRGFFNFHYDLEDYRFLKFMFYLTDVFPLDGNHVVAKGSHKRKRLRDQFSLTRDAIDQDILNYYGHDHVESIYGKAGYGFVEDFYCFHKATLPISSNRLILEMTFAMNHYSSLG